MRDDDDDWYEADNTIARDTAVALAAARTEFAWMRVTHDAFLANTRDDNLQWLAEQIGKPIDALRSERAAARARLAAASHKLRLVDEETR